MKTTFDFLLAPTLMLSFSMVTADTITIGHGGDYASMQAAIHIANLGHPVKLQALFGVWQVDS